MFAEKEETYMKIFKGVVSAFLFCSILSGCGNSVNVDELLKATDEAMKGIESVEYEFDMNMDFNISAEGMALDMAIVGEGTSAALIDGDNETSHIEMTMDVEMLGESESTTIESYVVSDGEEVVAYSNDGITGWVVEETSYEELEVESFSAMSMSMFESLKDFDAEVTGEKKINGEDCHVLLVKISSENITDSLNGSFEEMLTSFGTFGSSLEIPVEYYISKETSLLMGVRMDLSTMADSMMDAMSALGMEDLEGVEIKINDFYIEMLVAAYGEVEELEVPSEVIDEASGSGYLSDYSYESEPGDKSTQTKAWENVTVSTNSGEIVLNETTVEEFFNMGFVDVLKDYNMDSIDDGNGASSFFLANGQEVWISTAQSNTGEPIKGHVFDAISLDELSDGISIGGGIKVGDSEETIVQALGEADDKLTWDDGDIMYEYYGDDSGKSLTILVADGIIIGIDMYYFTY